MPNSEWKIHLIARIVIVHTIKGHCSAFVCAAKISVARIECDKFCTPATGRIRRIRISITDLTRKLIKIISFARLILS